MSLITMTLHLLLALLLQTSDGGTPCDLDAEMVETVVGLYPNLAPMISAAHCTPNTTCYFSCTPINSVYRTNFYARLGSNTSNATSFDAFAAWYSPCTTPPTDTDEDFGPGASSVRLHGDFAFVDTYCSTVTARMQMIKLLANANVCDQCDGIRLDLPAGGYALLGLDSPPAPDAVYERGRVVASIEQTFPGIRSTYRMQSNGTILCTGATCEFACSEPVCGNHAVTVYLAQMPMSKLATLQAACSGCTPTTITTTTSVTAAPARTPFWHMSRRSRHISYIAIGVSAGIAMTVVLAVPLSP